MGPRLLGSIGSPGSCMEESCRSDGAWLGVDSAWLGVDSDWEVLARLGSAGLASSC